MEMLDADKLITARRAIPMPFWLRVQSGSGFPGGLPGGVDVVDMTVSEILRVLPGKRIVAKARVHGRTYLIKTFLGRSAQKYAIQEERGMDAVARAGVRCPRLRWSGTLCGGEGIVLAFDFLDEAHNLLDIWNRAVTDQDKIDVLTRFMIIMARLHAVGVSQSDIHLNNFLLREGKLYAIDGGGIQAIGTPLSESASLGNLALFFAQLLARHDDLINVVLPAYEAVREWPRESGRLARLLSLVAAKRQTRKRRYIEKAFRECTRFVCELSFTRFTICDRNAYGPEIQQLLATPDDVMATGTLLKDGNSATVALVHLGDRALVVKRYNIKNPWHFLRRAGRKSRAWVSWRNAMRLEFLGIDTLTPVALIEKRMGPLRTTAYLVTEYIPAVDAAEHMRQGIESVDSAQAIAEILGELARVQITHGDMKATNFLMADAGPVLIDLDAMHEHSSEQRFRRAFNKDLDRFMANWKDNPPVKECFQGLIAPLRP
jgi:tRNA A-37 threonylcarbamoyl transferase component Bud32